MLWGHGQSGTWPRTSLASISNHCCACSTPRGWGQLEAGASLTPRPKGGSQGHLGHYPLAAPICCSRCFQDRPRGLSPQSSVVVWIRSSLSSSFLIHLQLKAPLRHPQHRPSLSPQTPGSHLGARPRVCPSEPVQGAGGGGADAETVIGAGMGTFWTAPRALRQPRCSKTSEAPTLQNIVRK